MRAPVLAAFAFLATPALAADPVELKWSLKEGDSFYATTKQEVNQSISVMGQDVEQKMTITTVAKYEVKAAKPGAVQVQLTYTKFDMDAGAVAPGAGQIAERFKGAKLTATFDKDFGVTKLEGYDKFLDKISDGDDMMRKVFEAVMPEDAIKLLFSQVFVAVPGKQVEPGDKWSRTDKVPLSGLGTLTNKTNFTLGGVKGDVATIKTASEVTFKPGEGNAVLPFKIKKADLKSDDVKGEILFDLKAGRVKSARQEMKLKGSMTIEVQNQEVEAKLDQTATTTVEIAEKNPVKD